MTHIGSYTGAGAGSDARGSFTSPAAALLALGPVDWIDASDAASKTLSGANITAIANKGSASDALTYISNSYMTDVSGGATCGGFQNNYQLGTAGDRNFLHDGTGGEWFFIFTQSATDTGLSFPWTSNISGSSNPGAYVRFDNPSTDADIHWVTRGASSHYDASVGAQLGNQSLPLGVPAIISGYNEDIASPATEFAIFVNGAEAYSFNTYGFNYTSANHADALRLCVSTEGTFHGFVSFDRKLSATERATALKALRQHYGLAQQLDTYVFIGDSLMNGGALNVANLDAAYNSVIPRSYIWGHREGNGATDLTLRTLSPENSPSLGTAGFGPDLTMLHTLAANHASAQYLALKQALSGDVTSTKWLPEGDNNNSWDNLLTNKTAFEAYLSSIGITPNYVAAVISLGTNDADTALRSGEYQAAKTSLISNLRSLVGNASLPIYLIRTAVEDPASRSDSKFQYQSTIHTAQDAIAAADANVSVFDPAVIDSALSWREASPNGIHYDEDACELVGVALAGA